MPPARTDDPAARRRPPGRYDEPSRAVPRAVAIGLSVLLVAFLSTLAWVLYQRFGADRVPLQVRGYEVLGDDAVLVEFDVTPPAGGSAWCLVRARNAFGEEIGREVVPVPSAADGGPVRVRHELATAGRPVTGEVQGCRPTPPPAGEPTAAPAAPVSP